MNPKSILTWSFSLFGLLLALLVGFGLILPSEYEIKREILINAPTADIHKVVGDLSQWDKWTPWKEEDPSLVITPGSKSTGVGASHSWTGRDGSGRLLFTKSDVDEGVVFEMQFNNEVDKTTGSITYRKTDDGTIVMWTMNGDLKLPIVGPYFALMIGSNAGPMFEKGLENLKRVVEKE